MNKQSKRKRGLSLMLSLLLTLGCFVGLGDVKASAVTAALGYNISDIKFTLSNGSYHEGWYVKTVNGTIAHCVEPGKPVGGDYSSALATDNNALKMSLADYFGRYQKTGAALNTEAAAFNAFYTQLYVWEILGVTPTSITDWGGSAAGKYSLASYGAWKAEMQPKIDAYLKTVSFAGQTVSLKVGETKTLTDTQGAFSYYTTLSNTTSTTLNKSSNSLQITATAASKDGVIKYQWYVDPAYQAPAYYWNSSTGDQKLMTPGISAPKEISINVTLEKKGGLKLVKELLASDIIAGNSCYGPVTEAEFSLYDKDKVLLQSGVKVNVSGEYTFTDLTAGAYFIQETKAPTGFALDDTMYPITVAAGTTNTKTIINKPQSDPVGILLKKLDSISGGSPQGSTRLAGAEFTVKYYDGHYTSESELADKTPLRTWVIKTDENGMADLLDEYIVSGDPLYYNSIGVPTFPLGTISIEETKAPSGYLINSEVFLRQITADGQAESVSTYNAPEIPDEVKRGGIEIQKYDSATADGSAQGDATLAGTTVQIINLNENPVYVEGQTYAQNAVCAVLQTDATGYVQSAANLLPAGRYRTVEAAAPEGYLNTGTGLSQEFELTTDGQIYSLAGDNALRNNVARGGVSMDKVDSDFQQTGDPQGDATLADTEVEIYNRSVHNVLVEGVSYAPNTVVMTLITDAQGHAETGGSVLPYGSYEAVEKAPPEGYLPEGSYLQQTFEIRENGVIVSLSKNMEDNVKRGGVQLEKWDMELDTQDPQGDATLAGTEIEVYNRSVHDVFVSGVRYQPDALLMTLTTDQYGRIATANNIFPYGTYEAIEKTPPSGYLPEGKLSEFFQIREDGEMIILTEERAIQNNVIRGGVQIEKWDAETNSPHAQGTATLAGTEIELYNRSTQAVKIEGVLYQPDECITLLVTDVDGIAGTANDYLPFGTYEAVEKIPPEGYLSEGKLSEIFHIRENGEMVILTADRAIKNEVIRGDLKGIKIKDGEETHDRLAGVPFRITSATTGESHVLVTDANGMFSTEASWNLHSSNTNRGETSADGIWFGDINALDDNKGALIYDDYIMEELPCAANEGLTLIAPFKVSVYRNMVTVDLGTLTDVIPAAEYHSVNIRLNKVLESDTTFPVEGNYQAVVFGVYTVDEMTAKDGTVYEAGSQVASTSVNTDGTLSAMVELPAGDFYVQEIATDEGFVLSDKKYKFSIAKGSPAEQEIIIQNGSEIENKMQRGKIEGQKKDQNGAQLAGAEIGLFAVDETVFTAETAYMTAVSDSKGSFAFADVPTILQYIVREISAPEGFTLNEENLFVQVDVYGTEVMIENKIITGNVQLLKTDADKNPLEGAVFGLFDVGEKNLIEENALLIAKSGKNGIAVFENIRYGKYQLKELAAPEGYRLGDKVLSVQITKANETVELSMENSLIVGALKVLKTDADKKPLEGAVFGLFDVEEKNLIKENALLTAKSGKDGIAAFENIRYGEYQLKELSAPKGYVLNEEVFSVKISEHGVTVEISVVNVKEGPPTPTPKPITPDTGDNAPTTLVVALLVFMLLGGLTTAGIYLYQRKRKKTADTRPGGLDDA